MLLTDRDLLLLGSWLRSYFEATTTNTPRRRFLEHAYTLTYTHARTHLQKSATLVLPYKAHETDIRIHSPTARRLHIH